MSQKGLNRTENKILLLPGIEYIFYLLLHRHYNAFYTDFSEQNFPRFLSM